MSDFCPDTIGAVVNTFLGSLVQLCFGEGGTLQTNNTGVCSQCLSHTGPAPAHGACALPAHTAQALSCSAGTHPKPALGCMHLPGLSRSGLGTLVVLRGADSLGLHSVPFSGPSSQVMRCLVSADAATYRLPHPCRSVFWVYNLHTFSGGYCLSRIPRNLS